MYYPVNSEKKEIPDGHENPCLVLDGTANLDYIEDEQVPRVKGLIELLNQYFTGGE